MNREEELSHNPQVVDFNIHGIVGVRFINAPPKTAVSYATQLGPVLAPDRCEPDIIVRFQDEFASSTLRYVGLNSAGFTHDAFYLLDKTQGSVKAKIPFEKIGGRVEILCADNVGSVPLLPEIINFTCLSKHYIPLHASAFLYKGVGVVVMGWPKGGKTGALLSFIKHGAQYIGDEWIFLSENGQKMWGLPTPVAISDWQFEHIPEFVPKIGLEKKFLFGSIHLLDAGYQRFGNGRAGKFFLTKLLRKGLPLLKRQLKITKLPQVLFKHNFGELEAVPDKLFLIMGHSEKHIDVQPYDSLKLACQMAQANEYEYKAFFEYYKAFKFAFPHLQNAFLDDASTLQSTLLNSALAGKETHIVLHPYGGPLETLFERIRPFCTRTIKGLV